MKSKNNLNRALKDALYEHQVPLNDSQWERISKELAPKRKRRFLPWFFIITAVIAGSSIAAYIKNNNVDDLISKGATESHTVAPENSNTIESNKINSHSIPSRTGEDESDIKSNSGSSSNENNQSNYGMTGIATHSNSLNNERNTNDIEHAKTPLGDLLKNEIGNLDGIKGGSDKEGNSEISIIEEEDYHRHLRMSSIRALKSPFIYTVGSPIYMYLTEGLKLEPRKLKKNRPENEMTGRWAFGLQSGFNMMKTTANAITNPEKLHMDSKAVFDLANKSQLGFNIQLSAEYKPVKTLGLTISSGLQYKKVYNNVNFEYRFTSYADRDSTNNIINYRVDSSSAPIFRIRESQSFTFVVLPIKFNYNFTLGSKHELSIGGGMVFGSIVSSSGRSFMINDIKMSTVGATINKKHGIGYTGSLGYSYNIGGKWWLGIETQIQTLNMQYDLHYGLLNARMLSSGLGVQIKYRM